MPPTRRILVGLLFLAARSFAEEPHSLLDHGESISFDEALVRADAHPLLAGVRRADNTLRKAADKPAFLDANPILSASVGPRVYPAAELGVEALVSLTQTVSLERAATRRAESLRAESAWLSSEVAAERLSRRLAVASAWLDLWASHAQLHLAIDQLKNEEKFRDMTIRLQAAGERTRADLATVDARLAEAELFEKAAEGAFVMAQGALASELAAPAAPEFIPRDTPPLLALPTSEARAALTNRTAELPAVTSRALLARAEQARAVEDASARGHRLTFGVEAMRDATTAIGVRGMLGVTLPFFATGQRERAIRTAAAERLQGEATSLSARAQAEVAMALHELTHTEEVWELTAKRLVPASLRAQELREKEYAQQETTLLDVIEARRRSLEARYRLITAERDRAWARIQVASLIHALPGNNE